MSHDVQTMVLTLASAICLGALCWLAVRVASYFGQILRLAKDLSELSFAAKSIDAQLKEFIPRYLSQGEPLAAVPNILKAHVGGLMDLKETIETFSRTIIGNASGNHIAPDERAENREDEILREMEKHRQKGFPIDREEAIARLEERRLWGRMGNLIPAGSDE